MNSKSAVLLVVHPDAQLEIIEAADWYDERADGLRDDLLASVDAAAEDVRAVTEDQMVAVRPLGASG